MGGNESPKTRSNMKYSWSASDNKRLCSDYDSGASIADLAIKHGRTIAAITIRLVKLGKIQPSPKIDPYVRTKPTVRPLYTKLPPKSSPSNCIDCGKILEDPSKVTLFPNLCEACHGRRIEEKKNIREKQKIIPRRIDEGIAGTREDHIKMLRWKLS